MSEGRRHTSSNPASVSGGRRSNSAAFAPTIRRVSSDAPTLPGPTRPSISTSTRWDASRLPLIEPSSYDVAGELAKGGIGRILRGHDQRLGRTVALKELIEGGGGPSEERFLREALITARLQHPSIVPVYEAGRWPTGEPFYAMKLVSGQALDEVIGKTRALDQRLALVPHVLAVTEAVAYAHSERIIHRDLKPSNVIVGAFGETVVIDWGLAKDLDEGGVHEAPQAGEGAAVALDGVVSSQGEGITMAGAVMGTPSYMPPEQASGRAVDERADVYALGAILYHVLAGIAPYEGKTSLEILKKTLAGPPPPLDKLQRGVPQDLVTIVNKAMARDAQDRYPTAKELADDLRRFQTGQIVRAHTYSRTERLLRFVRRHRAAVAVAAAATVVLAAGAFVSVRGVVAARHRAEQERDRAAQEQAEAEAARREAVERADELTLAQARGSVDRDPNKALELLGSLSPGFSRWGAARTIAADARATGVARVIQHPASVNAVALSPDGTSLATACDDKLVRLIDLATGHTHELKGHTDEVYWIAFSSDGRRLATRGKDNALLLWDLATGASRVLATGVGFSDTTLDLSTFAINSAGKLWLLDAGTRARRELAAVGDAPVRTAFSRDGKKLAAIWERKLLVWDVARGSGRTWPEPKKSYVSVAISAKGNLVATGDSDGAVQIEDIAAGTRRTWEGHTGRVTQVAFSRDGKTLISAGEDRTVRFWDIATGESQTFREPENEVDRVKFSPDGSKVATSGRSSTVRVWDMATRESRLLTGLEDMPFEVSFSPDGRTVAAGSVDRTARLWDLGTMGSRTVASHGAPVREMALSPDGGRVASGLENGTISVTDLASPSSPPLLLRGHKKEVTLLRFSPDGRRLLSTGQDETLRLWDASGGEPRKLLGHKGAVRDAVFSPDGKTIASAGLDATVRLWDVASGEGRVLFEQGGEVIALSFSPDGKILASGGRDTTAWLWDLAAGQKRALEGHTSMIVEVVFSPDGKRLGTGSNDHWLRVWDVASGQSTPMYAAGAMREITFLPGSQRLIASGFWNSIEVWDPALGKSVAVLRGHTGTIEDIALSSNGRRVATASNDHTLRLWDLETLEGRVLADHTSDVREVSFTPDSRSLLSASMDGTVRLWADDLPDDPEALRAWLKTAVPAALDVGRRKDDR